ncbi:MAG: phytanoyl-CoA dioxygenase family protein [Chloroflexota bacterium]
MHREPLIVYNDHHHRQFEEDGYLRLGQVLTTSALAAICERIDALMLGQLTVPGITFQLDGDTESYTDMEPITVGPTKHTLAYRRVDELHLDSHFLRYMQHPLFRQITEHYIGLNVSIFRAMFMNKPANKGTVLPWHQDVGTGWGIDSNPITTVWTALDDASVATGCMQIVPGSHKLGILNEGHYTSEDDQAMYCTPDKVIDLEVKAGEAILLHNWLLHRSGINKTDQARRAFSVTYMDASTQAIKSGKTFPRIFGGEALNE